MLPGSPVDTWCSHWLLTSSVRLDLTEHERGDLVTVMTSWGDDFEAFIDRSSLALCILAAAAALLTAGAADRQ